LSATVADDLYVTLPKNHISRLKASVVSKQPLIAPVSARQEVGAIRLSLDGKLVLERPLIAAQEMPVAGIFGRLWDSLKLMLQ
jgi:D-alanyl-D-alanine carboxypeptidase (penicillin-binding protein 5/6)